MTSLVKFLRKREPPLEEAAERYIKELEANMKPKGEDYSRSPGFQNGWVCAQYEMLRFLRGEET